MAIQGASLQPIYGRLNAVEEENPGSAVTFADWSMQAGDTVTITRDGKEYKSTVHSSTLVWKGKTPTVTINNNSSERRGAVALESRKKFGRGGSALRASENAYQSIETSYNNMRSGLVLASSSAALYVENMYTQMSSGLKLTSSSAALYVDNKYTQMSSGLKLTSSSAALYVDNKYNQLKAGLDITSSSAALYARSAENAAEIVARINESTGESEIHLDAQKVFIGNSRSTTVINGKLNASDVTADYLAAKIAQIQDIAIQYLHSERGGINVNSVSASTYYQGDVSCYLPHAIWALQIVRNGDNYTLQRQRYSDGGWVDVGSFSRATSLSGQWSGGVLTVTASPQGESMQAGLFDVTSSDVSWSGLTGTIKVYANLNGGETKYDTGKTLRVTAPFTSRSFVKAFSTNDTIYYGKLYNSSGTALTSGSYYWFGHSTNFGGSSSNVTLYTRN